ncbi:ribbon-helix-helix domain-containing protein [Segnochrobactraceae bacterium EtOH-i3]
MPATKARPVHLSAAQTAYIEDKIASGAYASASEVVTAGLEALQDRDAAFEHWLREEVAAEYDAMIAHPDGAIPAEDVFADLRARHEARRKSGA